MCLFAWSDRLQSCCCLVLTVLKSLRPSGRTWRSRRSQDPTDSAKGLGGMNRKLHNVCEQHAVFTVNCVSPLPSGGHSVCSATAGGSPDRTFHGHTWTSGGSFYSHVWMDEIKTTQNGFLSLTLQHHSQQARLRFVAHQPQSCSCGPITQRSEPTCHFCYVLFCFVRPWFARNSRGNFRDGKREWFPAMCAHTHPPSASLQSLMFAISFRISSVKTNQ